MEAIASISGLAVALIILYRWSAFQLNGISKTFIIFLFALKLIGALTIWKYYEKTEIRNQADIFKFYDDGLKLKAGINENPHLLFTFILSKKDSDPAYNFTIDSLENWNADDVFLNGSGHRFMIRLNALLTFISGNNYLLHLLFFTCIGLLGIILTMKALPITNDMIKKMLLLLLTISPTLLFWTSGVLKESVIIFLLGLLIFLLHSFYENKRWFKRLWIIVVMLLIFILKPYTGIAALTAITLLLLFKYLPISTTKIAFSFLILFILSITILPLNHRFSPLERLNNKRMDFVELATQNEAKSLIEIPVIQYPLELLYKGPQAILNVIFRPHIFEIRKKSYFTFALESGLILILLIGVIFHGKKTNELDLKFIYPSLFFILVLTLIIGLSTPILGASVRYRAPAIFLIYVITAIILDNNKLLKNYYFRQQKYQ